MTSLHEASQRTHNSRTAHSQLTHNARTTRAPHTHPSPLITHHKHSTTHHLSHTQDASHATHHAPSTSAQHAAHGRGNCGEPPPRSVAAISGAKQHRGRNLTTGRCGPAARRRCTRTGSLKLPRCGQRRLRLRAVIVADGNVRARLEQHAWPVNVPYGKMRQWKRRHDHVAYVQWAVNESRTGHDTTCHTPHDLSSLVFFYQNRFQSDPSDDLTRLQAWHWTTPVKPSSRPKNIGSRKENGARNHNHQGRGPTSAQPNTLQVTAPSRKQKDPLSEARASQRAHQEVRTVGTTVANDTPRPTSCLESTDHTPHTRDTTVHKEQNHTTPQNVTFFNVAPPNHNTQHNIPPRCTTHSCCVTDKGLLGTFFRHSGTRCESEGALRKRGAQSLGRASSAGVAG